MVVRNARDPGAPPPSGHNIRADDERLLGLIERIERLAEEQKGIADDIRDVYREGKATGYDVKAMRQVVAIRKQKPKDRKEMKAILEVYLAALGMDT